ncbi:hypothetical protein LSAT2_029707 [Lamellibrachia satsuma]|nr:hypothetical protein LSAT2_029707 [Lamellibrachia satsuma]
MGSNVQCLLKCVLLALLAVYLIGEAEGKGGRGGGGRGGSRGFRSSSRYRSSRSSIRTSRGRFPSGWKIAAGAGLIYGWSSYRHRSSYYRDQSREPQICENRYDFLRPNGSSYAYFICPLSNQSDSYTYCCGPSHRQHCCRFWDSCWSTSSPRAVGLPEQDFVGCFVMAHHMTCQMKTPLSHDGDDPWEGAIQFLVGHVVVP